MTGVMSSVGNPVDHARVTAGLLAARHATLTTTGVRYQGDGILVALPTYGTTISQADGPTVAEWVRLVAPAVTAVGASPRRYFGAWTDPDGTIYLDVVEAWSSAEEPEALAAARARHELAVWHNGRHEEIPTGITGTDY